MKTGSLFRWVRVANCESFIEKQGWFGTQKKKKKSPVCDPGTPSQITTSGMSKASQVRSLIAPWMLNHFLKHKPVVTRSMHPQSTYTPHLQHVSNLRPFGLLSPGEGGNFTVDVGPLDCLRQGRGEEIHRGCLAGL